MHAFAGYRAIFEFHRFQEFKTKACIGKFEGASKECPMFRIYRYLNFDLLGSTIISYLQFKWILLYSLHGCEFLIKHLS